MDMPRAAQLVMTCSETFNALANSACVKRLPSEFVIDASSVSMEEWAMVTFS